MLSGYRFISSIYMYLRTTTWSYQSWGWHSNCLNIRSVHSHSGSTSRYACVARSPGMKLCVYVVERLRSQICRCFMLGILARHIGTFLSCLVTHEELVTQARLSQEVFLAVIKSWCATIQYCCLLRSSSKPRGTHRIPWIRSRFWLTGLGIRIHHYKHGRQPRTVLEFSNNSYQFKTSPFTNKPFSNYKMINFQSTPYPAIPRKTIQWNIHTIPPTTPAPPPTGCKHPNPFIRGLRFYHHRSQGKRRSPLWFLPYQWGRGWIPWVDWLMLVAFENRKVFQNRIQDLVGCNTVFGSWDDEFYEYSLYDPRRGAFKIFFMFKFDNDFLWEVDAWHVDTID